MKHYPTAEELAAFAARAPDEDRNQLLTLRRSVWSILSGLTFLIIAIAAVYVLSVIFRDWTPPDYPVVRHLSIRWIAVVPVAIMLELVRRYHDDLYVIGIDRALHLSGRLSLNFNVPSIHFAHVRCLTIRQDILGRIFNYGDIAIGTAGHDGNEMVIGGILAPRELADLIRELKDRTLAAEASYAKSGNSSLPAGED